MRHEHFASATHARVTGKASNLSTSKLLLEFPILGVATRFETNEQSVASAVAAAYGDWQALRAYPQFISERPPLRIFLREPGPHFAGFAHDSQGKPITIRVHEPSELYLRGALVRAAADSRRGRAHVVIADLLLEQLEVVRVEVLDAVTLFLITAQDRTPIHAAAIADADVALGLAGPSGVGKSTLAHCAGQNGYQVLSEDALYVQLEPAARMWGIPRAPRPRPVAAQAGQPKPVRPDTRLAGMPPVREWSGLCLLQRSGSSRGALHALTAEQAVQRMQASLDAGFDRFRSVITPCTKALARGGAWLLELPDTPEATLPYVAEMMSAVRARRPA